MKLCVNCKHYSQYQGDSLCSNAKLAYVSPVDGTMRWPRCDELRAVNPPLHLLKTCARTGLFFEPK